ncbi:MAG: hypothetical protein ABI746_11875 [Dermatophilaceae bacterium]
MRSVKAALAWVAAVWVLAAGGIASTGTPVLATLVGIGLLVTMGVLGWQVGRRRLATAHRDEAALGVVGAGLVVMLALGLLAAAGSHVTRTWWCVGLAIVGTVLALSLAGGRDVVPREDRPAPASTEHEAESRMRRHVLGVALATMVALGGGAAGMSIMSAANEPVPAFSEFWVVPGSAEQRTNVDVGVRSHEPSQIRFEVVVQSEATPAAAGSVFGRWTVVLDPGEDWSAQLQRPSDVRVVATMTKQDDPTPYRTVWLAPLPPAPASPLPEAGGASSTTSVPGAR